MNERTFFGSVLSSLGLKPKANHSAGKVLRAGDLEFEVLETKPGGMGIVYICEAHGEGRGLKGKVALKTFPDAFFFNADRSIAFEAEAKLWIRLLGVPFVLPAFSQVVIEGKPHIVMLAIEPDAQGDVSLGDRLRRTKRGMEAECAFSVALCVALALLRADESQPGLVHRDIKPDNILMVGEIAMLGDFGLARLGRDANDQSGVRGTPLYLAPECWRGADARAPADIYALGCVLYEMLAGRPPFEGDIEALRKQHAESVPHFASLKPVDHPAGALQHLALRCLEKDPASRPSVKQLIADLVMASAMHFPGVAIRIGQVAGSLFEEFGGGSVAASRMRSMLESGDHAGARQLLDKTSHDEFVGSDLITAGSTASLSGDEELALKFLDRFLQENPSASPLERARCLNERALSLRRLNRLGEAERTFQDALADAPEESVAMLGGNYGATLLAAGKAEAAMELLSRLVRQHPNHHQLWAILSDAQYALVRADEALTAARRAIALAPREGLYRITLARALMDLQGDFHTALAALDASYGLGYHSPEWVKRTFICNMLTGNERDAIGLIKTINDSVSEETATQMIHEAIDESRKYLDGAPPFVKPLPAPKPEPVQPPAPRPTSASEPGDAATEIKSGPYVQLKVSMVDHSIALDFYYPTDKSDYAEMFASHFSYALRRAQTGAMADLTPRSRPHFFCRCRECNITILTNRDPGESLRCQQCGNEGAVEAVNEERLTALAAQIGGQRAPKSRAAETDFAVVALWSTSADQSAVIEEELTQRGFTRETAPGLMPLCQGLAAQRNLPYKGDLSTWSIPATTGEDRSQTPVVIDEALRAIRRRASTTSSISMTVPSEMIRVTRWSPEEMLDDLRKRFHETPTDTGQLRLLVDTLVKRGHVDEAVGELALTTQLIENPDDDPQWLIASGVIASASNRLQDADRHYARAIELNPLDQLARCLRIQVLEQLGDREGSERLRAELGAHGDPLAPIIHRHVGGA